MASRTISSLLLNIEKTCYNLQDLERAFHSDVATEAIDGLLNGVQLQFSQSWKDFVENITSNLTCKELLEKCWCF